MVKNFIKSLMELISKETFLGVDCMLLAAQLHNGFFSTLFMFLAYSKNLGELWTIYQMNN